MFCEIVEDHSPFYIKFKFNGVEDFFKNCRDELKNHKLDGQLPVYQRKISEEKADSFLNMLPFGNKIRFQKYRISYIITKPGAFHTVHIDRASVSFNFGIDIKDDNCVTSWFDPYAINRYFDPQGPDNLNRAIIPKEEWDKNPIEPIKVLTQKQNECIIFNSDIYHKFDNSQSANNRIILTLRPELDDHVTFFDARKILFNF